VALHLTGWSARVRMRVGGEKTVEDRLAEFGPAARKRWAPYFEDAHVSYPPAKLVLVGLKAEKQLEVYAAGADGVVRFIRRMPVLAASGSGGPKLKEGDRQVPEGIYPIEWLNPNSRFHVSMRIGYPGAFDREMAARDGRTNLGGDIMIHGSNVSIGCLAMGDEAAEDLFILAAETTIKNISAILAPHDFRSSDATSDMTTMPPWTQGLYDEIKLALAKLPLSPAK
jgi:murein L,D-transpeptidase YafK